MILFGKTHTCILGLKPLKICEKWFVKLYILAKYISRCIVFQSISLLSVGVGGVNVASVDEF